MTEILNSAVANRFISSLSKSLQALCHGCMEFEKGIEIVGFINVNIDSDKKYDYVLSENVQLGGNNSMTFVSNSYLAKKDQPKATREGACSPVPELVSDYPPYPHASPYPQSSHQSFQSAGQRSARKRNHSGHDSPWRGSSEKQFRPQHQEQFPPAGNTGGDARFSNPAASATGMPQGTDMVIVKNEELAGGEVFGSNMGSDNSNAECLLNIKPDPETLQNQDIVNQDENFCSESGHPENLQQQSGNVAGSGDHMTMPSTSDSFSEPGPSTSKQTDNVVLSLDYGSSGQGDESFDCIQIEDDEDEDIPVLFGDNVKIREILEEDRRKRRKAARAKQYWQKVKSDPEAYEKTLQKQRDAQKRYRDRQRSKRMSQDMQRQREAQKRYLDWQRSKKMSQDRANI